MIRTLVFLSFLSVPLAAQAPPPGPATTDLVRLDLHAIMDGVPSDELLEPADLDVREDGAVQTIESLRRVDAAAPRTIVIFLDTLHAELDRPARVAFARVVDRLTRPEDLVALWGPEMPLSAFAFEPKSTILSVLVDGEGIGGASVSSEVTGKEALYDSCYPPEGGDREGVAAELKARRRERLTLDALDALAGHLRRTRSDRTAVLVLTRGWRLYAPDKALAAAGARAPGRGNPFTRGEAPARSQATGVAMRECETDRVALALENHTRRVREVAEQANRATVSLYPVLVSALSRPSGSAASGGADASEVDSLRQIAADSSGEVLLAATAEDRFVERVSRDLSGYYLLTYRSTNPSLDGRFRTVTVRSRKPGVEVRTRRGYRALTADALLADRGGRESAGAAAANPRAPFRIRTAAWRAPDVEGSNVWLVGELDFGTRKQLAWTSGARAEVTIVASTGATIASSTVPVPAGEGAFSVALGGTTGLAAGEYAVRVQISPESDAAPPLSDSLRLVVSGRATGFGEPILWRRGLSTGPRYLMTADVRFQRSDRIRVEFPTATDGAATAAMLDRRGLPMQIPVQVSTRTDASGAFTWVVAEASLAPLAAGDYAIEVKAGGAAATVDFRVVP